MTEEIVTRLGRPEDLDDIMALADMVAAENAVVPPNRMKILEQVYRALEKDGGMVGVVGPPDGKPQGFVLLRIGPPWYGDERVIEECGVYVHPDHRQTIGARSAGGQGRAAMLYRFCKQAADQLGYKLLIGVLSRHRTEAKIRYYQRYFGEPAGSYFVYDPTGGAAAGRDPEGTSPACAEVRAKPA